MNLFSDEAFMRRALIEAQNAADMGEVPIGAIAVHNNVVIARSGNQVELLKDATAHAEILVLTQAMAAIGDWRLDQVEIFVTKEPCAMCAGALVNAHVKRLVYGLPDPRCGAAGSALDITNFPGMLWHVPVTGGVLADESRELIQNFFRSRRLAGRQNKMLE